MPTLQRTHINRRIPLLRTPLIKLPHINPIPPHRLRTQLPQLQPLLKHPHRLPITKHLHLPSPHKHRNKKRFNKSLLIKHRIFKVFLSFSIKAVNKDDHKEVKVTLDGEFTEEELAELADATITLTDADGKAITATFKEMDKDGKAIFEAAEELEDAKVYTVTSEDLSVPANTTVRAEVVEAYADEFFTNTEKISDKNKVVVFQAKDQYGEVMEQFPEKAEVTVTWKGMPLVQGENQDYTVSGGKVTVTKDIPVGKGKDSELTFNVTLKATDEEKEDVTFSKTFEVEEGKEAALTSVAEVTADKEEVKPEDTVTLAASFLDQYKNEITLGTNDEIRWVIKEGADLITVKDSVGEAIEGNVINKTGDDAGTLSYTANKPGKVAIEVFVTATGESASYEVTIGEADLKEITVEKIELEQDEKIYNNKDKAIATVKPNEGAKMTPEDVKFEVVDENGEDASEVVTVKAQEPEVKEGEEVKKDAPLNIIVNSTKSGDYKVTPYIEVDGKKVYSKDSVKTIEFTTEVENNITAISELDFSDETELKVGKKIRKDITFTNEHGEPVLVKTEDNDSNDRPTVEITAPSTLTVNIEDKKDEEGNIIGQEVVITANKAGKAVIFIDAGENAEPASYNLEFVNAVLTKVEFGENKVTGLVAGEETAKYNKVTFKDQHDVEMTTDTKNLNIVVTDKDGKVIDSEGVQFVKGNFNDEGTFDSSAENAEDFIEIVSNDTKLNGTYTITVTDKKTDKGAVAEDAKVKESFEVEVGEARKVDSIEVKPVSSTVAAGAKTKFIINVKDQYGEAFEQEDMSAVLKDEEQEGLTIGDVTQSKDGKEVIKGQYEFTVDAASTAGGEYVLVVGVQPTEAEGETEATEGVTKEVTITVGAGSDLVKSLEITGENIKDGKAEFPYFVDTKEEITTLGIKAFGEEGKEVNYETDKISWSVNNDNVTVTDGKVTVNPEIFGDKEDDVTFTVTAKHYGVTESIDLTVSKTPSKVQDGTIEVSLPVEEGKEPEAVTVVTIDKDAKDGQVTVTYSATDQYGKDANLEGMEFLSYNEGVATVAEELTEDNELVITAVKEGETSIEATIDGVSHMFDVIVTKEAAEAAKEAKATAKEALSEALSEAEAAKKGVKVSEDGSEYFEDTKWTTQGELDAFKAAIDKAQKVYDNEKATKEELEQAKTDLDAAQTTYENAKKDGIRTPEELTVSNVAWTDGSTATVNPATPSTATNQDIVYTAKEAGNKTYTVKLVASTEVENEEVTETKAELSDNTITVTLAQDLGTTDTTGAITATKADVVNAINALTDPNKVIEAQLEDNDKGTESVTATTEDIKVTGGQASSTTGEDKAATASFKVDKVGDAGTYTITLKNVAEADVVVIVEVTEGDEGTTEENIANAIKEAVTKATGALYDATVNEATVTLTAKDFGSKEQVTIEAAKKDGE